MAQEYPDWALAMAAILAVSSLVPVAGGGRLAIPRAAAQRLNASEIASAADALTPRDVALLRALDYVAGG